jgi:hypothetical protein
LLFVAGHSNINSNNMIIFNNDSNIVIKYVLLYFIEWWALNYYNCTCHIVCILALKLIVFALLKVIFLTYIIELKVRHFFSVHL